jgi:Transglycosylase SLT domain
LLWVGEEIGLRIKVMKFFSLISNPLRMASGLCRRISRGKTFHAILEMGKMVAIIGVAFLLSQGYFFPSAQSSQTEPFKVAQVREDFSPPKASTHDPDVKEILNLAAMIRFITNEQLSEGKSLRYAGLIFHASKRYGVNPIEIIALITAESRFKEGSINAKTGDYGLGQVNWVHWGKDLGLTHQDLLDPAINIYMTCHIFNYFGKDFGKYNRGHGVKSRAYVLNIKGIVSSLNAFAQLNLEEVS